MKAAGTIRKSAAFQDTVSFVQEIRSELPDPQPRLRLSSEGIPVTVFSPASKPFGMSLRGAFFATKQSPSGQSGLINGRLLRQKTARNDMAE
jgi:hypothetical protein